YSFMNEQEPDDEVDTFNEYDEYDESDELDKKSEINNKFWEADEIINNNQLRYKKI
ncbi:30707_t:CDS:1, partial [Gigaspora margarita]